MILEKCNNFKFERKVLKMEENKKAPSVTVKINGDASELEATLDRLTEKAERLNSLLKKTEGLVNASAPEVEVRGQMREINVPLFIGQDYSGKHPVDIFNREPRGNVD
jgi:hypothetical protein